LNGNLPHAVAGRIFRNAEKQYEDIYGTIDKVGKITKADVQIDANINSTMGEVTIQGSPGSPSDTVNVTSYGDTDYALSYKVG